MAAETGSMPPPAPHRASSQSASQNAAALTAPDASPGSQYRRRPFAWVKKLANFKRGADDAAPDAAAAAAGGGGGAGQSHRLSIRRGHRDSDSRRQNAAPAVHALRIDSSPPRPDRTPRSADGGGRGGSSAGASDASPTTIGARSAASTFCDHDGARSFAAPSGITSLADTSRTAGGHDSRHGADSIFSSPSPSVRSLTTTLTTIQSLAPTAATGGLAPTITSTTTAPSIQYHQPFPTTPASAIPPHLAPAASSSAASTGHPTTYSTATANNLLTDNASILTLASSSKRRRRRSLDTDASVRALAPSSLWGGSRESLPLSVLSASVDAPPTPGLHPGSSGVGSSRVMGGLGTASAERASVYSPADRSSLYARADAASVRSGYLGHGRTDSINGAVTGSQGLAEREEEA
jgi:hypothetical protein